MRKLLLTSVCALGALGMAAGANAQAPTQESPLQGKFIGKPGATPGANNNNNAFGTARPGPSAVPTPGTLVIHFNSRVMVQWFQGWNSLMKATPGFNRTSNQMASYLRFYGGADGMAANGLRYGGAFEIRMNVTGASNTPAAANPASQASAVTNTQTLYVRRAFVYAGMDKFGIVRLGQGDGLISLFDQGRSTLQTYSPTSHFNGSDLQSAIGGNSAAPFAFIVGSGDEYDTQKLVYLSPNFSGFDFGLMYSPHAANAQAFCGGATSSACANVTTSAVPMDGARFKDMIAAGIRYQGDLGPVNVHAYGVYSYAGHVSNSLGAAASRAAIGAAAGSTWNGQFDNLNFGSAGVALTWQGVTVGANVIAGAVNGRMAARPSGGAGTMGYLVGAQYKIPGIPMMIGTAFESINSQGGVQMTTISQRHEYAVTFGGSYTLAPGMILFADYLYQHRKQSGFNFLTGTAGAANNSVQGQGIVFGTQMTW